MKYKFWIVAYDRTGKEIASWPRNFLEECCQVCFADSTQNLASYCKIFVLVGDVYHLHSRIGVETPDDSAEFYNP